MGSKYFKQTNKTKEQKLWYQIQERPLKDMLPNWRVSPHKYNTKFGAGDVAQ
jgi:hypothetical protein